MGGCGGTSMVCQRRIEGGHDFFVAQMSHAWAGEIGKNLDCYIFFCARQGVLQHRTTLQARFQTPYVICSKIFDVIPNLDVRMWHSTQV